MRLTELAVWLADWLAGADRAALFRKRLVLHEPPCSQRARIERTHGSHVN